MIEQKSVVPPGYGDICNKCVYRDFYDLSKLAKDQATLIKNFRDQLIAVSRELEELKAKKEEDNTD